MFGYRYFLPSRTLNERPSFLGLEVIDFASIGGVYMFSFLVLHLYDLELFAGVVAILVGIMLIPIRMKHRRSVIRDWFFYFRVKVLNGGDYHDPSHS